jgi:uncharacterized protein YjgD (DUF1641 family)
MITVLPLFYQELLKYTAFTAGLVVGPRGLGSIVAMLVIGYLGNKVDARVEHAEAVLAGYKTLQTLHDSGSLDILRGLAGANEHIIDQLSEALNTPEMIRGIRNLLPLSKLLGNIDPDRLESVVSSINEALEKGREEAGHPPGIMNIFKRSHSEDSRRALNAAVCIVHR